MTIRRLRAIPFPASCRSSKSSGSMQSRQGKAAQKRRRKPQRTPARRQKRPPRKQKRQKGYIYNNRNTFTEWYDGRDVPQEYRVTPQPPQRSRPDPEKADFDAAAPGQRTAQTAEQPQEPRPVIPIVLTSEKPAEKLKEITDRLEQGIAELFDSERYKEYLKVMSKFHNYSFRNTVLIAMQKPDASLVAGFSAWKNNFERNVMKGQKGIKIIAPSPYKIKQEMQKIDPHTQKPIIGKDGKPVTEEKEVTIPAYKVVSVFDVSQTEGKELPDIAVDELTGDVDRYKDFFAALEKTSPVPIAFENIEGGSHGYYHLEDKRIAINEGMSELQTLKTAIHEIAHAKLHDIDLNAPKDEQQPHVDRRTREVEAESVAYTVCQHYGLDTSDYSFGYVAGWSSGRELSELKSSLETIRSAAAEIINSIDENLAELQKAQDKEQTAGQEQPTREEKAAPKEQPQPEAPAKADTAGKEKPEAAAPGKSGAQEKAGAAPKEAFTPETIYKMRRNPYGDSPENSHLLSLTTEKKLFCQTSAKEKRCNSKKIATLSKSCSVLSRTFLFALFFDFGNLFCRCGHNPYACIAHTVKKRVELPPLRVLLRRRFQKELVYGYIVAEHKLKENL